MKNQFKKMFILLLVFSLVLGSSFAPMSNIAYAESLDTVTITVLGTSDIHSFIYPWEYKLGEADSDAGLAKVYSVVKEVRAENPDTILIDNGDTIQGTELTDVYKNDSTVTFPIIDVMNYINYDAWVLGNHEFNYGLDVLNRIKADAKFPVLGANIYNEDDTNYVTPYIIKEVDGVKVGILGMITPNIPRWDGDKVVGMEFKSLIDEGKKWVKVLREDEKVDVVIASIHCGLEGEYWEDGGDSVKAVAEQVSGIDAILAGHAHADIEGEIINGVLISEPKRYGNRVSRFDFTLEKTNGAWNISNKTAKSYNTKTYEAAPEILDLAKDYHQKTLDYVNTPIGEATNDFVPANEISGIPTAQIQDTALVDLINKIQMKYSDADISLAALFISESNLKKGPLTIKDAAYIYKYDNTLYKTKVTGAQLKAMMEWSAKYFNTFKPGDVTISFNPNIRGYNYDMYAGVNYDIDISEEPGNRIKNLTFNGNPVTNDMELTLALNNYRYGGMKSEGYITEEVLFDSYEEYGDDGQIRNLIAKYIREEGTISPEVDNNWKIIGADLEHWGRDNTVKLLNEGIMEIPVSADGRTPNVKAVNLEEKVTRGEFIKALVKAVKLSIQDIETTVFTDVEATLAPYIDAAVNAGITNGVSETLFNTNGIINREQAFVMLMRAIYAADDYDQALLNKFTDNTLISSWAKEELSAGVALEIISGYTDNTIRPKNEISRGELTSIISKYLSRFKRMDILTTNDIHGNIEAGYEGGAAKLAAYMDFYKSGNPDGTIILDAGDAFQGTPLSNVNHGKPVVEIMSKIGYTAMVVGNHEFDWGIDAVLESLGDNDIELLSSNIYENGKLVKWATPYIITQKNNLKVGIIGFSTPETAITAHADYVGSYEFKDPIEIANTLIPKVKAEGADIVVILSHISGYQDRETKEITGDLADLAREVVGADAIIGGHSHQEVAGIINDMPVLESYKNGRMIGQITLIYDTNDNTIIGKNSETHEVRKAKLNIEPLTEVQAIVDKYNEELKPIFGEVIGTTEYVLERNYDGESAIGNWIVDIMKEKSEADFAFTNAGGIRADLQAGDITVGDIFKVMPFDNTIATSEMTGAQIKAVLEQSVTLYKGMLKISGMKFTYDSTKPEYERVIDITLSDGTPIDMEKVYKVTTNDFLSGGQDGFVTLKEVEWLNTYELIRDALLEDLRENGVIDTTIDGRSVDVNNEVSMIEINQLAA